MAICAVERTGKETIIDTVPKKICTFTIFMECPQSLYFQGVAGAWNKNVNK